MERLARRPLQGQVGMLTRYNQKTVTVITDIERHRRAARLSAQSLSVR
jgi:hypothetical protein